jgi:hypothetical protein
MADGRTGVKDGITGVRDGRTRVGGGKVVVITRGIKVGVEGSAVFCA